ncbi:MAG: MFS transporter [Chloroflexota bacterium]
MDDGAAAGRAERLGFTALGFPAFRAYFGATLVTNSAQFVQSAGIGWISWEVTGSAAGVAAIGFLNVLPYTLLTLHSGLLTDRFGGRRMVVLSLVTSGIALTLLGIAGVAWGIPAAALGLAAFILGVLGVIGGPGGFTIVNDILPRHAIPSALALIFLDVNLGRILGGIVGGIALALLPGGWTLVLAGVLMLPPALAIRRLPTRATPPAEVATRATGALVAPIVEAAGVARRSTPLALLYVMTSVMGSLGQGYNYQLPVTAVELGAGADGLGLLTAVVGVGGLVVGLILERLMRSLGHGRTVWLGTWLAAGGMMLAGTAGSLPVAALGMGIAGAGFAIYAACTLALIQALAPAALRGRLTALFSLLYWGLMPAGALIGGIVAEAVGARTTLLLFGIGILATSAVTMVGRPGVRRLRLGPDGHPISATAARPAEAA